METIRAKFGPFDNDEIQFYKKELTKNGRPIVNKFQQNLINDMFYKYFGDTVSINSINADEYIILMITAKRILERHGMILLPYIISGVVLKISTRTSLCKKELIKLEKIIMNIIILCFTYGKSPDIIFKVWCLTASGPETGII